MTCSKIRAKQNSTRRWAVKQEKSMGSESLREAEAAKIQRERKIIN